jgi:hypothetical protein
MSVPSNDERKGTRVTFLDQTLLDASVQDWHHLIVYPEIVAG